MRVEQDSLARLRQEPLFKRTDFKEAKTEAEVWETYCLLREMRSRAVNEKMNCGTIGGIDKDLEAIEEGFPGIEAKYDKKRGIIAQHQRH